MGLHVGGRVCWGLLLSRVWLGVLSLVCGLLVVLAGRPSDAFAASWAPGVEVGLPANAGSTPGVFLNSVSCPLAGDCSAVGGYTDSAGHRQGLLLTETGGTWTRGVEATLPVNAGSNPN